MQLIVVDSFVMSANSYPATPFFITRYFYKKALLEYRKPERLPPTLEEALLRYCEDKVD